MLNGTSELKPVNPDLVKLYCVHEEKTDEVDKNLEASHTATKCSKQSYLDPDVKKSILKGQEMEKEMASNSSILAWKILWTGEPGGIQSMGKRFKKKERKKKIKGQAERK